MIQPIDPTQIDPNPFQPRLAMDEVALNRLADDIHANGLLQPPAARKCGIRYQLIYGHRRLAAWKIAHPGLDIDVDVREMDDRQMFAAAIVENDDREPLNAIERARALQAYISKFKVKQEEAGLLFGLRTQASVSNLLRLLKLPAGVQQYVASGDLPERYAREMIPLLPVLGDKHVGKLSALAEKLSTIENQAEAESAFDNGLTDLLMRFAPRLGYRCPFPADWLPVQTVDMPHVLPACNTCKDIVVRRHERFCARSECYAMKEGAYAATKARDVATALNLPATSIASQGTPIVGAPKNAFDGNTASVLKTALEQKHPGVLLLPVEKDHGNGDYWRGRITGSEVVDVTLKPGVTIEKLYADLGLKKPKYDKPDQAAERDKEKRQEAEYDRLEVAAQLTVRRIVPLFRGTLTTIPAIAYGLLSAMNTVQGEWADEETIQKFDKDVRAKTATQPQLIDVLVGDVLWDTARGAYPHWYRDMKPMYFQKTRDAIAEFAQRCKVKLPKGWDAALMAEASVLVKNPAAKAKASRK